jgi:hypothetical protein
LAVPKRKAVASVLMRNKLTLSSVRNWSATTHDDLFNLIASPD